MKRIIALLLTLILVLSLAVGCKKSEESSSDDVGKNTSEAPSTDTSDNSDSKEGELVGVAMPTKDLQRWNQDGENMKKALEDAGYTVEIQYASNDVLTQVSQVETMISNGCKVLVVASIDGSSLGVPLAQAKEAGIKVIAYDRLLMDSDAVSYSATFVNNLVGTKQGEFIEDK